MLHLNQTTSTYHIHLLFHEINILVKLNILPLSAVKLHWWLWFVLGKSIAISRFANDVVQKKKSIEYQQDKLNQDDLQMWTSDSFRGELNRKQRIPVDSITPKLVLKSIYASGSTGLFFADHYLKRLNLSFAKKADFLSRYLVLSEKRYARQRNWSKTGTESSVKSF